MTLSLATPLFPNVLSSTSLQNVLWISVLAWFSLRCDFRWCGLHYVRHGYLFVFCVALALIGVLFIVFYRISRLAFLSFSSLLYASLHLPSACNFRNFLWSLVIWADERECWKRRRHFQKSKVEQVIFISSKLKYILISTTLRYKRKTHISQHEFLNELLWSLDLLLEVAW